MKKLLSLILIATISLSTLFVGSIGVGAVKKPKAPTEMKITGYEFSNNCIQITFPTIPNATGYEVKAFNNKNVCVSTTNNKSYSEQKKQTVYAKKVKCNNFYKLIIRSYIKAKGKTTYSNNSKAIYGCLGTTINKYSYSSKTKKHTFKWAKTNGATNYILQISKNKDIWCKVASTKSTSCSFTKVDGKTLNRGYLYDVRVISQKKVGTKIYKSYGKIYSFHFTNDKGMIILSD